jgi:hypothetical protein
MFEKNNQVKAAHLKLTSQIRDTQTKLSSYQRLTSVTNERAKEKTIKIKRQKEQELTEYKMIK